MDSAPCTILIPAAGKSSRFKDAGYRGPKGLLRVAWRRGGISSERLMVEHCLQGAPVSPTIIACRAEEVAEFMGAFETYKVKTISSTDGQAHTCEQALRLVQTDILIVNSDNAFEGNVLTQFVSACRSVDAACGAVVFECPEYYRRYGYVDGAPWFNVGVEKVPISKWALAGAFYFKSYLNIHHAYQDMLKKQNLLNTTGPTLSEHYLSGLFEFIDGDKLAYRINRSDLHEWGTPGLIEADPFARLLDKAITNEHVPDKSSKRKRSAKKAARRRTKGR